MTRGKNIKELLLIIAAWVAAVVILVGLMWKLEVLKHILNRMQ